jgi:hypothetical protein
VCIGVCCVYTHTYAHTLYIHIYNMGIEILRALPLNL